MTPGFHVNPPLTRADAEGKTCPLCGHSLRCGETTITFKHEVPVTDGGFVRYEYYRFHYDCGCPSAPPGG